jgi:hypothetical protein
VCVNSCEVAGLLISREVNGWVPEVFMKSAEFRVFSLKEITHVVFLPARHWAQSGSRKRTGAVRRLSKRSSCLAAKIRGRSDFLCQGLERFKKIATLPACNQRCLFCQLALIEISVEHFFKVESLVGFANIIVHSRASTHFFVGA